MYHHTIAPAAPYGLPLTVKTLPQYLQGSSFISQENPTIQIKFGAIKYPIISGSSFLDLSPK
jgi:hypothetical protein